MTGAVTGAHDDPIEQFLDRLLVSLNGSPRQVRHTLAEAEAHLRDAAAEGMAAGLSEQDAQAWAVDRMGPVHVVTGRAAALSQPSEALLRRLLLTAFLVGGAGFLAIGGAGLIGRLLQALKGTAFLTAPWPPGSYTRADCARWLAGDPGTHSCITAMLADHAGDIMLEATAAGLFGLLALAAYLALRQRWRDRATMTALPAGSAEALGAVLAGLGAVGCFAVAYNTETAQRGMGAGVPWSLGLAAAVTAVVFALALLRTRRTGACLVSRPVRGRPGRADRRQSRRTTGRGSGGPLPAAGAPARPGHGRPATDRVRRAPSGPGRPARSPPARPRPHPPC
jgi:hypothetical protein